MTVEIICAKAGPEPVEAEGVYLATMTPSGFIKQPARDARPLFFVCSHCGEHLSGRLVY